LTDGLIDLFVMLNVIVYTYESNGDASVWSGEDRHTCQYTPELFDKGVSDGLSAVVIAAQLVLLVSCILYQRRYNNRLWTLRSLGAMGTWLLILFSSLDLIREIIGLATQWDTSVIDHSTPTRDDGGSRAGFFVLTALPNIALVATCNMAYLFFRKLIRR
jgi:hypothetical protein